MRRSDLTYVRVGMNGTIFGFFRPVYEKSSLQFRTSQTARLVTQAFRR